MWSFRATNHYTPQRDGATWGWGAKALRQTRAAVGGGIAHQIHNKVLRGGAAAERPSWLRSQPPHQAAEEPPFFFLVSLATGGASTTDFLRGRA